MKKMKNKNSILTAFAVLALLAGVSWVNFGWLGGGVVSAEEFAAEFKAKTAGKTSEAASGVYEIDKNHSAIGFAVKHMGLVDVPGYFTDFAGTIRFDAENPSKSSVEFTAKAASIDTRVDARDKHLRSADFFDVEKYPDISFKSTKVQKKGKKLLVTGDFSMHGVTKTVTLPVAVTGFAEGRGGQKVMGATAETVIDRAEYGIKYGIDNGSIGKDVRVILQIEAKQAKSE